MPTPTPGVPNIIPNPPELQVIGITATANQQITLTWTATPGLTYRVQFKEDLNSASWTDLPGAVTADTTIASKTDSAPLLQRQRFYRVLGW